MPSHYGGDSKMEKKEKPTMKKATMTRGKMSDAQKSALTKHMEKAKKGGMSASEAKSHRMKMMGRMRRGLSVSQAHKDIMK